MRLFMSFLVLALSFAIVVGCSNPLANGGNNVSVDSTSEEVSSIDGGDKLSASVYTGYGSDVMLQGFGWNSASSSTAWYQVISNNSAKIKANFQWVWFPPPTDSGSNEGYMPRELLKFTSKYGTETQLKNAITAISPTKAVADIVINHRVGSTNWADFTNPSWVTSSICGDDEYFYSGNPGSSVT
ncbi:MAG TPA: hypothetical protein PLO89_00995, partial [Spirochaetota bacterium]|nr:hypothetical protein [Spirochaetota bacterium]